MTFDPRDRLIARSRSQVLYRYRPNQTFDHPGQYVAQVRQFGRDDAFQGAALDDDYLIGEAMRFVTHWRLEGQQAAAVAGSDRAPEFPEDLPLANRHYQVVIPGKVFCRVWPLVIRCANTGHCGLVWETQDPHGRDWPAPCPRCGNTRGNRQLQYVLVHPCGEVVGMRPPRECPRHHTVGMRLNDKVSRFQDFRWECLDCGVPVPVRAFCPNRAGCQWPDKMMSPQVHTASSAYVGHGRTLVNVPREDFTRLQRSPAFVVGVIGRWLNECTQEEATALAAADGAAQVPQEVLDSINAMERSGVPELEEQARVLRRRFIPIDLDELRDRITKILDFDPIDDPRGHSLAAQLGVFDRVLQLGRVTVDQLERSATSAARAARYSRYRRALERAGLASDGAMLINDFPVTYLAIGYSRGGFGPREADLVAYKGRAGRGQALTNLIYASPTETEALVFKLDRDRVARWLVANDVVKDSELRDAGGPLRWFAANLDPDDGAMPRWNAGDPRRVDPDFGARALYQLLHSVAHQILRAVAVDSGFSETSLSEYLFPYDLAFAIHPNGGSEFTIGGLRTVMEQNLDEIVERAVDNATCIYDPNCMIANRGADHGCLQLPETACQVWNRFISRWDLYGSPDGSWTGFWDPSIAG